MKIAEVRTLLENYSEQQLRLIIAEMYKAIPKAVKEDKDIDGMLSDPDALIRSKTPRKKHAAVPDVEELRYETEQFIEYARNQYYFAPNSFVSKRERPKWRFLVKRVYKALLAAAADGEQLPLASDLLEQLYTLLCYSCSYTLFSAYDSFQSVGIEQSEFFQSVLTLKFAHIPQHEFIKQAISLVVDNGLNRYTLYTNLMDVVLGFLPGPDAKELAIQTCDELLQTLKTSPAKTKKGWFDQESYARNEKINNLVEMTFLCCGELHEFERGIQYFSHHYVEKSPEVKLYILLQFLFSFAQSTLFIREYENAVKQGIKPREKLVTLYQAVQATGEFPEHFY
ncbi:MAG: hypothetical protein GY801_20705 [bacterium]|nr:hypothetical protein [bacterium]